MDAAASSGSLNLLLFGIPTLIIADDPRLITAAAAAYANWLAEAPVCKPQVEVRLTSGSPSSTNVSLDIVVEGSRLRISGPGIEGEADALTGKASATLSRELVDDRREFDELTDTLLLFLLARSGRTPVHAAAFMARDMAMVLAGPSGSGKSTLALAAERCGLPILSDDMLFVQLHPSFALWGFPRPIHVFLEDAPTGDHPTRVRNRKVKAAVPARSWAIRAERAALVLLDRGPTLALEPIEPSIAVDSLMNLDAGFDLLKHESASAIEALASRGSWRLTLTDDPFGAIDLILSRFAA